MQWEEMQNKIYEYRLDRASQGAGVRLREYSRGGRERDPKDRRSDSRVHSHFLSWSSTAGLRVAERAQHAGLLSLFTTAVFCASHRWVLGLALLLVGTFLSAEEAKSTNYEICRRGSAEHPSVLASGVCSIANFYLYLRILFWFPSSGGYTF